MPDVPRLPSIPCCTAQGVQCISIDPLPKLTGAAKESCQELARRRGCLEEDILLKWSVQRGTPVLIKALPGGNSTPLSEWLLWSLREEDEKVRTAWLRAWTPEDALCFFLSRLYRDALRLCACLSTAVKGGRSMGALADYFELQALRLCSTMGPTPHLQLRCRTVHGQIAQPCLQIELDQMERKP